MIPCISIIIPTFNRSFLLYETLISVRNQTFSCWECIVIDDGSNDQTLQVVEEFMEKDSRFIYFKRPPTFPKGAASCRNFGFIKSRADYIQWLDDDDLLSENKLEMQYKACVKLKNPHIFLTCEWDFMWPGKQYSPKRISKEILEPSSYFIELRENLTFLPIHSFLMSKQLINEAGPWNVHLKINDDAEFMTRILLSSSHLFHISECSVLYREHNKARINRIQSKKDLEDFILSLRLMHTYLKSRDIRAKSYFKWKLLNIFLRNWKIEKELLKRHKDIFSENGIYFVLSPYYFFKYYVYKKWRQTLKININFPSFKFR